MSRLRKAIIRNGGEAIGISQTRRIVQQFADRKAIADGKLPSYEGGSTVSQKTVRTYHESLGLHRGIRIKRSISTKPISRIAAENSLRSTMSFLLTVAATSLMIGTPPDGHPSIGKTGTTGSKQLVSLVKKSFGRKKIDIFPVHRSLLSSTDDTILFVCPTSIARKPKNEKLLVSARHDPKTQMYYQKQPKNSDESARGMRVKLTFTFLGNGLMMPIYVTAAGFTERDIPRSSCPSGILVIPIPGLCMERNRDRLNQKKGYLVLLRSDVALESVHMRNHEHYYKTVYEPYINDIRKNIHGYEVKEDEEIPDVLTSVGWMDGDIQQLKAVVKNELRKQCLKSKIRKCKQSARRTGVEQMCDVSLCFKELKRIEKETTLSDIVNESLSEPLEALFKEYRDSGKINIPGKKINILKDFLSRLPYMIEKACTVDNVVQGFVDVGLLDSKDKLWPDLNKILRTKRKNLTAIEKELVWNNFSELFKITMEKGHVPEEVYDRLNFPKDSVGKRIFERDHPIASEWRQRSKEITHEYQHELRKRREELQNQQFIESMRKEREELENIIMDNKTAEEKLLSSIRSNNALSQTSLSEYDHIDVSIENASLLMFSELTVKDLKAFYHVRVSAVKTIDKSIIKKIPNKGKFEDAFRAMRDNSVEDTLVSLAFKVRNKLVLMK